MSPAPSPSQLDEPDAAFREFLANGSPAALARVFDRVAPELLLLARQLAADSHAAEDLVQATFLTAIEHAARFDPTRRVVPWLAGILANHARMQRRSASRRLDPERVPRERAIDAAAEAERREAAAAFKAAIDALPEPYRDVIRLGLLHDVPVPVIAQTLGRPPETVKTQLRRGRQLLEQALPLGLASAVVLVLVRGRGLAAVRESVLEARPSPAPVGRVPGAIKLVASVGLLTAVAVWQVDSAPQALGEADRLAARPLPADAGPQAPAPVATMPDATERPTGSLLVRCRWAEDGQPAAGLWLTLRPIGPEAWFRQLHATSGADGTASFPTLEGRAIVKATRGGSCRLVLTSGVAHEADLEIPRGVTVRGSVVDAAGAAVPDATIWLAEAMQALDDSQPVSHSDAGGAFTLEHVQPGAVLFARKDDLVPPVGMRVLGEIGGEQQVRLQLRGRGGTLRGRVFGPDGRPAAGARVLGGWGAFYLTAANTIEPPLLALAASDGSFEIAGLTPTGSMPVWARDRGTAVAKLVVAVRAGETTEAPIHLARPATVRGIVRSRDGKPVPRARLIAWRAEPSMSARWYRCAPAWGGCRVAAFEDGSYLLPGLPEGTVEIHAEDGRGGATSTSLQLGPGDEREWSPLLAGDPRIRGTLRDALGEPLAGWRVRAHLPENAAEGLLATAGADGRFDLGPCDDREYVILAADPRRVIARPETEVRGVRPGTTPVDVVVPPSRRLLASIEGRVRAPDGSELATFEVELRDREDARGAVQCEGGRFRAGPLAAGPYWLTARAPGLGTLVLGRFEVAGDLPVGSTVQAGEHRFARTGAVRLHCTDRDGGGVAVTSLAIAPEHGPLVPLHVEDGVAATELQPGRYHAQVWDERVAMARVPFTVRAGETTSVEVRLVRGRSVRLRFDPVARPTAFVVEWRARGGEVRMRQLLVADNAAHHVQMRAFEPGAYEVSVSDAAGRTVRAELEIPHPPAEAPAVVRVPLPQAQ